jgi:Xaa-Pro aminopeptidase
MLVRQQHCCEEDPADLADASEYLAPSDMRRSYITGFTGSAGCAVVTPTQARCWTDGRYWLQAEKQLGRGWTLMKQGLPDVPTWGQWLKVRSRGAWALWVVAEGSFRTYLPALESG